MLLPRSKHQLGCCCCCCCCCAWRVRQHNVKAAAAVAPRFRKSLAQQLRQLPKRGEKKEKRKTNNPTQQGKRKRCQRQEKCRRFGCRLSPILAHTHTRSGWRGGEELKVGGAGIKITFRRSYVKYYEFLHFRNSFLSAFPSSVTPQWFMQIHQQKRIPALGSGEREEDTVRETERERTATTCGFRSRALPKGRNEWESERIVRFIKILLN